MEGSREGTGATQEGKRKTGTVGGGPVAREEMIMFTFIRNTIPAASLKLTNIHLSNILGVGRLIIIGVTGS